MPRFNVEDFGLHILQVFKALYTLNLLLYLQSISTAHNVAFMWLI